MQTDAQFTPPPRGATASSTDPAAVAAHTGDDRVARLIDVARRARAARRAARVFLMRAYAAASPPTSRVLADRLTPGGTNVDL